MTAQTGHKPLSTTIPQNASVVQVWRWVATAFNEMLRGGLNNAINLTLTANASSTTVSDHRIGGSTRFSYGAMTANAAAEIASGTLYYDTPTKNSVVFHHANNAQTDRTFGLLLGG